MVHGMDAEAHGRPAEFGLPATAPWHGVVGGIAVPKRVAHANQRPAELARIGNPAEVAGNGAEAHLENAGGVGSGALLDGFDAVEFCERTAERFFAHRPGP